MPGPRGGIAISGVTRVRKVTLSHTQFQTAGLTNNITLLTLAPNEMVKSVTMRHSAAFVGGVISAYSLSVGIAGNLTKYMAVKDVFTAATDTLFYGALAAANAVESFGNAVALKISAISVGANLNASTAGSVDVWIETIQLP